MQEILRKSQQKFDDLEANMSGIVETCIEKLKTDLLELVRVEHASAMKEISDSKNRLVDHIEKAEKDIKRRVDSINRGQMLRTWLTWTLLCVVVTGGATLWASHQRREYKRLARQIELIETKVDTGYPIYALGMYGQISWIQDRPGQAAVEIEDPSACWKAPSGQSWARVKLED